MNRTAAPVTCAACPVPRARGDEPAVDATFGQMLIPFPALAGMNRFAAAHSSSSESVPRARGDEPFLAHQFQRAVHRSPRSRG